MPYAIGVGVFAISMVFAGRAQDRLGPRVVATVGGALCGVGMIVASFATPGGDVADHRRLRPADRSRNRARIRRRDTGCGEVVPADRKGLITGIVVAGFGLASVYIAPLTTWLLETQNVSGTFRILGIAFFIATVALAQLLNNPPAGYVASSVARGREGREHPNRSLPRITTGATCSVPSSSRSCGRCTRSRHSRG